MIFRETHIEGVFAIDIERDEDERGFFARTYCVEEFALHGLNTDWLQCNVSHSDRKGTLRGIHYQAEPEPDAKLVRVTRGAMFAAVVDLRPGRRSFGRHFSGVFSETDGTMLYVPAGCGLGYQTVADETDLFYQMSVCYRPELARGVRWNDPALGIRWPMPPVCVSARDADLPGLHDIERAFT